MMMAFFFVAALYAQDTFIQRYPTDGQFCGLVSALSPQGIAGITGFGFSFRGSTETLLGRINPDGSLASFNTYSSGRSLTALSVAAVSDGGFIVGGNNFNETSSTDRILLFRTTPGGGIRWKRSLSSGTNDNVYAMVSVPGGFIVAGATGNRESQDFLFLKIDAAGKLLWSRAIGDSGFELVLSLAALPDGGVIAAGEKDSQPVIVRIDSNGNVIWIRQLSSSPFAQDSAVRVVVLKDGSYLVAAELLTSANRSTFLAKLNSNGNRLWSKNYSPTTNVNLYDLISVADGGAIVTGQLGVNPAKPLVFKIAVNGLIQWKKVYSEHEGSARTAAEFSDGTILVSGCLQTDRQELFAMRVNSKGAIGAACTQLKTAAIRVASRSLTLQTLSLPVRIPQLTAGQPSLISTSRNVANMTVCASD